MDKECFILLDNCKGLITKQQYLTFKGQIKAGDYNGFKKGLNKLINRSIGMNKRDNRNDELRKLKMIKAQLIEQKKLKDEVIKSDSKIKRK